LDDIDLPDSRVFREDIDRALRVGGGKRERQRAMARRPRQQFGGRRVHQHAALGDDDGAGADRLNFFQDVGSI